MSLSRLLPVVRVFFLFLIRPVDGGKTSWLLPVAGDSSRCWLLPVAGPLTLQQPGLLEARSWLHFAKKRRRRRKGEKKELDSREEVFDSVQCLMSALVWERRPRCSGRPEETAGVVTILRPDASLGDARLVFTPWAKAGGEQPCWSVQVASFARDRAPTSVSSACSHSWGCPPSTTLLPVCPPPARKCILGGRGCPVCCCVSSTGDGKMQADTLCRFAGPISESVSIRSHQTYAYSLDTSIHRHIRIVRTWNNSQKPNSANIWGMVLEWESNGIFSLYLCLEGTCIYALLL